MKKTNSLDYIIQTVIISVKIVLILCVVSLAIQLFLHGTLTWPTAKNQLFYNFYYGIPLSFINGFFFDKIDHFISWEKNPKKRAWVGFLGSILLTVFTLFLLNLILWVIIWDNDFSVLFSERNRMFYLIGLIITILVSSIIHVIAFFGKVQEQHLINQKLKQEKLNMELNALKSHLDPHFLFNSFNVLSGLIDENTDKAQNFLSGMSKIYRYVLEKRDEDKNSIREEIEFAKQYLSINQTRFENSLFLKINVDEITLSKFIPSLSLQLLLENALKHNAFDSKNPLTIRIDNNDNYLIISNNVQPRKTLADGNGIGLKNIKDRYAIFTDHQMDIIEDGLNFTVKLPCL